MFKNLRNLLRRNKDTEPVQQPIVGIDISHSFVRVVQLEKKKKVWSIVKLSSKVLADSYESEDKRNAAIVTQLKNVKLEQKIKFDEAAISLPVNSAIVQVVQIPYLEEAELEEAAEYNFYRDQNRVSLVMNEAGIRVFRKIISRQSTRLKRVNGSRQVGIKEEEEEEEGQQ